MPPPTSASEQQKLEWQAARQTFEQRCVVCHGCYDSPRQLKLSSWDGIARGASKDRACVADVVASRTRVPVLPSPSAKVLTGRIGYLVWWSPLWPWVPASCSWSALLP